MGNRDTPLHALTYLVDVSPRLLPSPTRGKGLSRELSEREAGGEGVNSGVVQMSLSPELR
jgi:hypothetical protein